MSFPEIAVLAMIAAIIAAFGASLKWLSLSTVSPFGARSGRSTRWRQFERYSLNAKYALKTDTGQLKANAYFIGYQLELFNDFDFFAIFPPPIGDQFRQADRRKIYGGNVSYAMPGSLFGLDQRVSAVATTRRRGYGLPFQGGGNRGSPRSRSAGYTSSGRNAAEMLAFPLW